MRGRGWVGALTACPLACFKLRLLAPLSLLSTRQPAAPLLLCPCCAPCSGPEKFDITAPPAEQAAAVTAAGAAVCSLDLGLDTVCDPALVDEICALTSDGEGSGAASE